MAQPKTKNSSFRSWAKRHFKLAAFILIIVLVVVGYFVYEAVALQINRRDFKQARANIDLVYADIVSKVGQPDNFKRTNYCARSYQEFTGYTSPTCNVDTTLIYGVRNEVEANEIFKEIQLVVNGQSKLLSPTQPKAISIQDKFVVSSYYHTASDGYRSHSLSCIVNYVYDTPRETTLSINNQTQKPFEVTIGCYGSARAQYYPLAY